MALHIASFSASLQTLLQLQQNKQYPLLAQNLLSCLETQAENPTPCPTEEEQKLLGILGQLVLKIFSDSQFTIPEALSLRYISCTVLIANLVALSSFKNTDLVIKLLVENQSPLEKILPLYSYRNNVALDIEELFCQHPTLTFGWWTIMLLHGQHGALTQKSYEMRKALLRLHALETHPNFINGTQVFYQGAFCCTYLDDSQDAKIKTSINKAIRLALPTFPAPKKGNPKKILVITGLFHTQHAVYKSLSPLIRQLDESYELHLIYLGGKDKPLDEAMFRKVTHAETHDVPDMVKLIQREAAGIILFPDIGMHPITLALANIRLAPIQIAMYGHPVSSFCPMIDYFMVSGDAEIISDLPQNYSEHAVVLPGLAAASVYPNYARQYPTRTQEYAGKIIIGCSWGSLKMHYDTMLLLKQMIERSRVHLVFRFTDLWPNYGCYTSLVRDVQDLLGAEHVECLQYMAYNDYMHHVEEADFALDSYPFGGYNRVIDTLHCGRPIITLEGKKLHNRVSAVILRHLALDELIATTPEAFVATAVRLAEDSTWRKELTQRVEAADLKGMLAEENAKNYFKRAIDYIVKNDESLRKDTARTAIFISRH